MNLFWFYLEGRSLMGRGTAPQFWLQHFWDPAGNDHMISVHKCQGRLKHRKWLSGPHRTTTFHEFTAFFQGIQGGHFEFRHICEAVPEIDR